MSAPTTDTLDWRGVLVEVRYDHEKFGCAHIEVEVIEPPRAPIPVTATGYRSNFLPREVVEDAGGAIAYVQAWLDQAALDRKWIASVEKARQGELF